MTLDELGPRLCIMGPSNSGKSTLATAISLARAWPAVHLDRLHHRPGTDWLPRPADEFATLHAAAIAEPRWLIEGNYSRLLPARLERATGLILLDVSTATSLARYLRRCRSTGERPGALEGARDRVRWAMIRRITGPTRTNRRVYAAMFETLALPKLRLAHPAAVRRFRETEGLLFR